MQARENADDEARTRFADLEALLFAQQAAFSEQQAQLEQERAKVARLQSEIEKLRDAHARLRQDIELLRRRIYVAKAERIDTRQLELEFAGKLADLKAIEDSLPAVMGDAAASEKPAGSTEEGRRKRKNGARPKGRRNLADANLPERRIEITDPLFEDLVKQGKAVRVGFELSYRLGYERGGHRKVVIARATYRAEKADGKSEFETAALPPQTLPGILAAPSKLGNIVHQKFGMGLPFFRLAAECGRVGAPVDRGTLCRWAEGAGSVLGATVIEAMRKEALATAFCIATDATGIAVLPPPHEDGRRQPCKRGHFFVQIADRDHVFFEYTARETSEAVAEMFRGFSGYVQADAKSVFDVLYRPPPEPDDDAPVRTEVGCMAHCRRRFWEAAIALKCPVAREGLFRLRRIYQLEAQWESCTFEERHRLRNLQLRPELDAFFVWAAAGYETEKNRRGLLRSAFGYAVRQREALMRFLDDGRLRIDNNESERNIKLVATGRRAWLFVGSDDHGVATGHILSAIASARLHGLDAELYLRDIIRVLCHWPRDRYIELAPKYWAATRNRLVPAQLAAEYGPLDVPEPPAQK